MWTFLRAFRTSTFHRHRSSYRDSWATVHASCQWALANAAQLAPPNAPCLVRGARLITSRRTAHLWFSIAVASSRPERWQSPEAEEDEEVRPSGGLHPHRGAKQAEGTVWSCSSSRRPTLASQFPATMLSPRPA